MQPYLKFAVVSMAPLLGSCSLAVPSTQELTIRSVPSDAQIYVNDINQGSTPVTVRLSRKDGHEVSARKAGYKTYRQVILSRSNSAGEIDQWVGTALFLPFGLFAGQNAGGYSLDTKSLIIHLERE